MHGDVQWTASHSCGGETDKQPHTHTDDNYYALPATFHHTHGITTYGKDENWPLFTRGHV